MPPRTGKFMKNVCRPRKALSAKVLRDMRACKQNLFICVQDNRRTIFARFSRDPENGPQTACDRRTLAYRSGVLPAPPRAGIRAAALSAMQSLPRRWHHDSGRFTRSTGLRVCGQADIAFRMLNQSSGWSSNTGEPRSRVIR